MFHIQKPVLAPVSAISVPERLKPQWSDFSILLEGQARVYGEHLLTDS